MAARSLYDRTIWELGQERGPVERSQLHRVALALKAVGAVDDLDGARQLIWKLGDHATLGQALDHADVDIDAIRNHLRAIESDQAWADLEAQREQWKTAWRAVA